MKKKKNLSIVILVASLLLAVTMMNTLILFTQTHDQTRQAGAYQLESVSGRLESAISSAENLTMELAIRAREHLGDMDSLREYIFSRKSEILAGDTGAFNLYIAGADYSIIPDFEMPEDYIPQERVWYTGALKNNGKPYVSSPYQDAMTGDICYTVSVMLGDQETVIAVDYTMESIRGYVSQMGEDSVNSFIVTDEGIIAGCTDETMVGKKLIDAMPDYAGIYGGARTKSGVTTARIREGFFYENLFAARSGNGWYLIIGISDWTLYHKSYIQLLITSLLSMALFAIVITLYLSAQKSSENAKKALASRDEFFSRITGQISDPLNRILEQSDREKLNGNEDYEDKLNSIHSAGIRLSEMVGQIMSYKSIIASEKKDNTQEKGGRTPRISRRFRRIILIIMLLIMLLTLYTSVTTTYRLGNARMQNEAGEYDYQLSEWINTQKSILDMFVSMISTNPEMLDDYEGTVEYLRVITAQYPEISVTYMTNPEFEHTVYMSNGWEPDEGWHVEERQWYMDTLSSENGWSVSAPYYDEQTGGYCLTISEVVYDDKTGEFLGIFGIDFFMDKLVQILGDSYTSDGYAFLVDPDGEIINHPYGAYQMTQNSTVNVQELPYGETRADGITTGVFKDYDRGLKILIATRNEESNFVVYVVSNAWRIYGTVLVYALVCLVAFLFCMIFVYRLLTDFIVWQEKTNSELKDAADAAIAAGKAKSSFLAQMSHEIRTPINAVLGMNEMVLRETDSDEIRDYAENIRSAGRTLLSLINSILDFSKIEDGKMELEPVKYDVVPFLNDLVNSISERAKSKGLKFELIADDTLPSTLYGDDVRIRQVIMNLLTNAVKYTEEGSVTLRVSGRKTDDRHYILCVSVKDTGIGIREEDREKLFESFARLDVTRNRNIEGTGLGMSIVTRLLDMMGSSVNVESEYGKGSEFSFELEQELVNAEPIGDLGEHLRRGGDRSDETGYLYATGAKILVVDDNSMNRKVARSLMKRNGIVPDEAASGPEAIDKMTQNTYDIVFLDHMMPKMDGIETLGVLKEKNLIPAGCVIIALTANAVSGARDRYIEAGFDDYLSKPIEVAQLEKKLEMWLPGEKVSRKTARKTEPEIESKAMESPADMKTEEPGTEEPKTEEPGTEGLKAEGSKTEEPSAEEPDTNEVLSEGDIGAALEGLGIDIKKGLVFCGDDMDFYIEILNDYVNESSKRKSELDEQFESGNITEFQVKIHSLKSSLKTIGAMTFSEKALELENAAKDGDVEFIKENYPPVIAEYTELVEKIRRVIE